MRGKIRHRAGFDSSRLAEMACLAHDEEFPICTLALWHVYIYGVVGQNEGWALKTLSDFRRETTETGLWSEATVLYMYHTGSTTSKCLSGSHGVSAVPGSLRLSTATRGTPVD
jgi:hypothetical protein